MERATPDPQVSEAEKHILDWDRIYLDLAPRVYNYFRYRLGREGDVEDLPLASGLFLARRMYDVSSSAVPSDPSPSASSPTIDVRPRAVSPLPADQAQSNVVTPHLAEAAKTSRIPGQLVIGATVAIAPTIKVATGFMTRNMNISPPFSEPVFSIMSENTALPALCDSNNPVDMVVISRRVRPGELDACRRQNRHISEVKLGYEAVVLVRSKLYDDLKLDSRSIFLALAREIPDPLHPESLVRNPNVTWDQVDPALPSERIDVSGPTLSSETGIAFRDLVLKPGCLAIPTIAAMKETDPDRFEEICDTLRTDGVYHRVGEIPGQRAGGSSFDLIGYLQTNPEAIALLNAGAMGLPLLRSQQAQDSSLAMSSLDGVVLNRSTIYSGSYPGARVVYLYANTALPQTRNFALALWSAVNDGHELIVRQSALPLVSGTASFPDAQYVAAVIPVQRIPAATLVPILRPLLPQQAHLAAAICSNSPVIVDTFANIRRIESLVAVLDTGDVYKAERCSAAVAHP